MQNRPFSAITQPEPSPFSGLDGSPGLRLTMLWSLYTCGMLLIAARVLHLQLVAVERFVVTESTFFETIEFIPSRDGRILTSDGRILAYDALRYDLELEFRWLQDPPHPDWLDRQARSRLSREERWIPGRIEQARREVLAIRDRMWAEIIHSSHISEEDFHAARRRIQQRVERIHQSVAARRQQRDHPPHDSGEADLAAGRTWWERGWHGIVAELTNSPHADPQETLVVKEELEHHVLVEGVSLELISRIEAEPGRFPGARIRSSTTREYPAGSLAAHLVGIRTPWTHEDQQVLDQIQAAEAGSSAAGSRNESFREHPPRLGDRVGRFGIESRYDQVLRGRPGIRRIIRNVHGDVLLDQVVEEVVHGSDLVLSLDGSLQERAEALLAAALTPLAREEANATEELPEEATTPTGGCIIAVDIFTGEILAAASAPTYDLNVLIHPDPETWRTLNNDPRRPFHSRAIQMVAPPGSVFKILTAIAALETGVIQPETLLHCQGYLDDPASHRCYLYRRFGGRHGDLDVSEALAQSCNVFFFAAARQMGPEPIIDWALRFGFGEPTGLDLHGEPAGNLPMPPGYLWRPADGGGSARESSRWYPGTTLQLAIGQASLTVSPLQAVRMVAAVANEGWLMSPRLLQRIDAVLAETPRSSDERPRTSILERTEPRRIDGLSLATLQVIQQGLRQVVQHPQGTGRLARVEDLPFCGKTGTAEVGGGLPDHAWFVGYAPADQPRVAFVVMLEHGGSGGRAAGPIARELVLALQEFGHLPP